MPIINANPQFLITRKRYAHTRGLIRFAEADPERLNKFLFEEACRTETARAILTKTKQFLAEQYILQPSDDTLNRLIARQREQAKEYIYKRIAILLAENSIEKLESLISTADSRLSAFHMLKHPAGKPSPGAMLNLIERLETIQSFGIMDIDLSWLNNNFQRALTRYAKQCTATRLRRLERNRRHAVMVCFLWQRYLNTIDSVVDMYDKLINKIYKRAQVDVDDQQKKRKLPDDAPLAFIPKKLRPLVKVNGVVDKAGWECALLTAVRDEIKAGNISVKMSKRFGRFDIFHFG